MIPGYTYAWSVLANDPALRDRAVVMAKARARFRYRFQDPDGYSAVLTADALNVRNDFVPGEPYYCDGSIAVGTKNPTLVGYCQEELLDNEEAYGKATLDADTIAGIQALPATNITYPLQAGQPDSGFADEGDGLVAVKHGDDILFVNLYYRGHVRVFMKTPTAGYHFDGLADDAAHLSTTSWTTGTGSVEPASWPMDIAPDSPIGSDYGAHGWKMPGAVRPKPIRCALGTT